MWTLVKIVNKHNDTLNAEAITFPVNEMNCVSLSLVQSDQPKTHLKLGTVLGNHMYLFQIMSYFPVTGAYGQVSEGVSATDQNPSPCHVYFEVDSHPSDGICQ